jgi:hypothetical protein
MALVICDTDPDFVFDAQQVSTPMEDFKLRMPKLIYDDESVAGAVTDLFRNMHDYWHKKRSEARDQKPRRDTEFNAMAVGELLAGRVLYQPKSMCAAKIPHLYIVLYIVLYI